jgi:hypothetical protein
VSKECVPDKDDSRSLKFSFGGMPKIKETGYLENNHEFSETCQLEKPVHHYVTELTCFNYGKTSRSFGFNQEKNQAEEISFERIDCKWPRAGGQENFRAGFCVKRYFGDTFVKVQKP